MVNSLSDDDFVALTSLTNKATAWMFVGAGGFLIAVKETYELVEQQEWHLAMLWVLAAVMVSLALGNVAARTVHVNTVVRRRRA